MKISTELVWRLRFERGLNIGGKVEDYEDHRVGEIAVKFEALSKELTALDEELNKIYKEKSHEKTRDNNH
jgi:hypothetical protein